jgi:hypothetical protein
MAYLFKDDSFTNIDPPTGSRTSGNTITYDGFEAVNQSANTLHDVAIWLPYVYATLQNGTHEALTWDNTRHGWFTPHFIDASGIDKGSLLLTAAITGATNTQIAIGTVADQSGNHQYSLSSFDFLKNKWPLETLEKTDRLPFANLGDIGPHQSKSFDITFTATWGSGDTSPQRAGGWVATLVPDTKNQNGLGLVPSGIAIDG